MKLYHTAGSPPSRAVLMTIRNLGLEVDIEHINLLKGEQLSEEFVKLNSLHQVPVLVDGDFVLSESRAIQAYLVNFYKPGSHFYPNDPRSRAFVDQMLYFDATVVFLALKGALAPIFFSGLTEVSKESRDKLKQAFKHLDNFLEGKDFFAGSNPTIADFSIVSNIVQAKNAFIDIGNYENLNKWYKRCEKLTGFDENLSAGKTVSDAFRAKGIQLKPLE